MLTSSKKSPAYTDLDNITFGKHKGKPLGDVPASYLSWLWSESVSDFCGLDIKPDSPDWFKSKVMLANYIWNSQDAIEEETGEELTS